MATKNIVPNADSEGQLGTSSKFWSSAYLDGLNIGNDATANLVFTPSASDTITLASAANGAFTITTVDAAAAAANVGFVVDGNFTVSNVTSTITSSSSDITTFATTNATSGYTEFAYNTSTVAGYIGNGTSLLSGAANTDFIMRSESGAIKFTTGGGNLALTIDSSQNAAFAGSINTSGNLQLSNGSPDIFFHTTGNHYNWMIAAQENVSAALEISVDGATGTGSDTTASNYTPVITALASGNVGIGTTSPFNNVQIKQTGDSGNNYLEGTLQVGGGSAVLGAALSYSALGSGKLNLSSLNNGGGTNATINLGFGAITSGAPANTVMTLNQSGNAILVGTLNIGNGSASTPGLNFAGNGDAGFYNVGGDNIGFAANGAAVYSMNTDGITLESGKGLFVGGTGSANKLDDYEEGTWDPLPYYQNADDQGKALAAQVTANQTAGFYTKIGNMVHVHGSITWNISDAVGDIAVDNVGVKTLPFASANETNNFSAINFSINGANTIPSGGFTGELSANSTILLISSVAQSGNQGRNLGTGDIIVKFSCSYRATT